MKNKSRSKNSQTSAVANIDQSDRAPDFHACVELPPGNELPVDIARLLDPIRVETIMIPDEDTVLDVLIGLNDLIVSTRGTISKLLQPLENGAAAFTFFVPNSMYSDFKHRLNAALAKCTDLPISNVQVDEEERTRLLLTREQLEAFHAQQSTDAGQ